MNDDLEREGDADRDSRLAVLARQRDGGTAVRWWLYLGRALQALSVVLVLWSLFCVWLYLLES